eukprot:11027260-Karenia_brevis.AAC.1
MFAETDVLRNTFCAQKKRSRVDDNGICINSLKFAHEGGPAGFCCDLSTIMTCNKIFAKLEARRHLYAKECKRTKVNEGYKSDITTSSSNNACRNTA